MSISYGLNLGIMNGAADGDLYGNAMRAFQRACDAFLQPVVKGYLTNTPPGSPVDGDMYIIGSAPTGSWASYAGYVAKWSALLAAWEFYLPKDGWQFQSNSAREIYRYTASAWEIYYQEGTWAPSWTGLTVVGTPTYTANFTSVGRVVSFTLRVQSTTSTSSSGGGMTYFTMPAVPSSHSTMTATSAAVASLGSGLIFTANGNGFVPSWSALADLTISGTYKK